MAALRVLHLVGSAVDDFYDDLSRLYARDCLAAVNDPARYEPHVAHVSPDGTWRFPGNLSGAALAAAEPLGVADAVARLISLAPDVAVPQMFCRPGMTTYRSLLDLLCIPFVGNRPDVMALTADKARAKAVVAAAGVAVPPGEVVRPGGVATLEPPAVVKPLDADNSLGVALVHDPADYPEALEAALAHGSAALVEAYVPLGREVRCGTLVRDGEVVVLPVEEYALDHVRTSSDKVARNEDGELALMAKAASRAWILDRDDPVVPAVADAARRCHVALGCRDYGLFDLRIDLEGRPWFLEAGLYCSFARQSVLSVMARAAGVDVPELFATALAECLGDSTRRPRRPIHAA